MKIGERGQVTIPLQYRRRFGLKPATEVEFVTLRGQLVLKKADPPETQALGQELRPPQSRGHSHGRSHEGTARPVITALDTNVLLDIWLPDPVFGPKSVEAVRLADEQGGLVICEIVYAELSPRFASQASFDRLLDELDIKVTPVPRAAAFSPAAPGPAIGRLAARAPGSWRIF